MTDGMSHLAAALADRYRIERELGAGGMATVYLAEDLKHHRQVAVKVLRPELSSVLGAERFVKEIEVTANLQHPHLLPLFDSGEAAGHLYYVMPYVTGETLRQRLRRETHLGVEETLRITRALAAALDCAHRQGVVHRDLKPENILFHEHEPVLADFGIALAVKAAGGARLTETGLSLGTPHYMSPEQAAGDRTVDVRSDVYALGAVVYEMLAGEPPHTGPTAAAILLKVMTVPPVPLSVVRPAVPASVEGAVLKALAKAPADRFATTGELAAALATAVRVTPPEKSIVVLPFDNLSPDPNDAYLADGLTEELISDLSRIQALRVISRNSAIAAKHRTRDVREVAQLLGVRHVLEGSVRRAGSSLRITVQLTDGASGSQLWTEKYGGTMDDVFGMQERLSRAIVEALRLQLSSEEDRALGARPVRDLRVYEVFLRARQEIWAFDPAGIARARNYIRQGLELAPDDAELWASSAYVDWLAYGGGLEGDRPDTLFRFGEAATRAVALDPRSALGWFALGRFAVNVGQAQKAMEFCRRSGALAATGDALALEALLAGYLGEEDAAVAAATRALELDPLAPVVSGWSAIAMYCCGRSREALPWFDRVDPEGVIQDLCRGVMHAQLGNRAAALPFFERLASRPAGPGDAGRIWLAALGARPWVPLADATRSAWFTEVGMALFAAEAYAAGERWDDAIDWLRVAVFNGFRNDRFLTDISPHFAPLRGTPAFETLVVIARGQAAVWKAPLPEAPG